MEEFKIKKQGSMYNNSCVYCHNVVRGDTKSDLFNLDDTHWQLNLMRDYPVLDVDFCLIIRSQFELIHIDLEPFRKKLCP